MRFGVLVDSYMIKKWQYKAIQEILINTNFKLNLVVINKSKFKRNISISNLFFYGYKFLFVKSKECSKIDIRTLEIDFKTISCEVYKKGKFSEYFYEPDINRVKDAELSFCLRFGYGILRGEILNCFKFGLWSFHHGDEQKYRGGPYCYWEIFYNQNITAAMLQRLTNKLDAGVILRKGFFKTKDYSFNKNIEQSLRESSIWPMQVCKDIENGVADYLNEAPSLTDAQIYKIPSNYGVIQFGFKVIINKFKYLKKYLQFDHWRIGYINKPIQEVNIVNLSKEKINWLKQRDNTYFLSDPFIVEYNENIYFIAEKLVYTKGKGDIVVINKESLIEELSFSSKYHYSYPQTFTNQERIYQIKESYEENNISICRSITWPDKWETVSVIIDFKGIDSTVVFYNNKWWLFTSIKGKGHAYNLHIYYSETLEGHWISHVNNPVKCDIKSCRGAGDLYFKNNELFRPAQNYSISNERSIVISRVEVLNEFEYKESFVTEIDPLTNDVFNSKIHTISHYNNITIIDACITYWFYQKPVVYMKMFYGIFKRRLFGK